MYAFAFSLEGARARSTSIISNLFFILLFLPVILNSFGNGKRTKPKLLSQAVNAAVGNKTIRDCHWQHMAVWMVFFHIAAYMLPESAVLHILLYGYAEVMKKLAKDKMLRALSNVAYAKGDYEKEMGQAALKKEAMRKL